MFETYKDIFNQRSLSYHRAMIEQPFAREEEFYHVINLAEIAKEHIICDIPAGGGYLKKFMKDEAQIISVETSTEFMSYCQKQDVSKTVICDSITKVPLESASIDRIISLAALHHESNKKDFYQESFRLLKEKGILCIADVLEGTGVAKFLNIFVDQYNSMGHKGEFLNPSTKADLQSVGFKILYAEPISFNWKFDSLEDMVDFCQLLFHLDRANKTQILEGIEKYLGYQRIAYSHYLNWELYFLKVKK